MCKLFIYSDRQASFYTINAKTKKTTFLFRLKTLVITLHIRPLLINTLFPCIIVKLFSFTGFTLTLVPVKHFDQQLQGKQDVNWAGE